MISGYLVRAGRVCDADWERMIEVGLKFISAAELKSVAEAFPATTQRWMTEGAERFNSEAMKGGIEPTCTFAISVREQAEYDAKKYAGSRPLPEQWMTQPNLPVANAVDETTQTANEPSDEAAAKRASQAARVLWLSTVEALKFPTIMSKLVSWIECILYRLIDID
jgi:hypothetical protein